MSVTTCDPSMRFPTGLALLPTWNKLPAPLSMRTSNPVLAAADTDSLFPPVMATAGAKLRETGALDSLSCGRGSGRLFSGQKHPDCICRDTGSPTAQ